MTEKKEGVVGGGGALQVWGMGLVSVLTNPFHVIISDIKHTRHLAQTEREITYCYTEDACYKHPNENRHDLNQTVNDTQDMSYNQHTIYLHLTQ